MLSRGPRPPNDFPSSQPEILPHPPEVARVFNTIAEILAASAEIIRRDEVYPICLRQLNAISLLTVVPTLLERKLMFTYCHVGQSICPLRISMGRGYVAPSIRHSVTSQALNDM